ncbi:MAG: hypothetical protein CSYNP_02441 [Syntrophus sp. SKADARSKE-3]|nr:hypothetical protein [Syntrophus sp. SKADARSKE-3]
MFFPPKVDPLVNRHKMTFEAIKYLDELIIEKIKIMAYMENMEVDILVVFKKFDDNLD